MGLGCLCQQIINIFSGLGEESGGYWRGNISSLDKKSVNL
jgi:hypothetical protein